MIGSHRTHVKGLIIHYLDHGGIEVRLPKRDRSRFLVAATSLLLASTAVYAQKATPATAAAGLSGTWKVNRDLSDSLSEPTRGGRGGALFAAAAPVGQRGGRRGGGDDAPTTSADLTPEELAAQAAIRELQGVAEIVIIKATADSISFSDAARGERTYPVNGKKVTVDIASAKVNVKSSWAGSALKQQFSTPRVTLTETWQVAEDSRLVLKAKMESLTTMSKEVKTVFDRQ